MDGDNDSDKSCSDSDGESQTSGGRTITYPEDPRSASSGKKRASSNCNTSKKVLQLESERPWTWAFCLILEAYGALMEDSHNGMSQSNSRLALPERSVPLLLTKEMVDRFTSHRIHVIGEALQCSQALLSEKTSVSAGSNDRKHLSPAQLLPLSAKSLFRYTIEKTLKAVARALHILIQEVQRNDESGDPTAESSCIVVAEALACAVAWLTQNTNETGVNQPDLCVGVRLWSCSEARVEGPSRRLNRAGANILVADKGSHKTTTSVAKKLEKALVASNDVEQTLGHLHDALHSHENWQNAKLQIWDRAVVAGCRRRSDSTSTTMPSTKSSKPASATMTFSAAVASKLQELRKQYSLCGNHLQDQVPQHRRRRKLNHASKSSWQTSPPRTASKKGSSIEAEASRKRRASFSASSALATGSDKPVAHRQGSAIADATTRCRKSTANGLFSLKSRNSLVQSWLEMDRVIGQDEAFQEDAYADLEDILVEG